MTKLGDTHWRSTQILRHLLPRLKTFRFRVAVATSCLLSGVFLRIVEPWPLQYVLDAVISEIHAGPTTPTLQWADRTMQLVTYCAVGLVIIVALRASLDYVRTVIFSQVGNGILTELRGQAFQHVQNLSLGFHSRSRNGDLTVRLISDINLLRDVTISAVLPLVSSSLLLVSMSAVMIWMNWRLGCVVALSFPVFFLLLCRGSFQIFQSAQKQRLREGAMAATASESLLSAKFVQAFGAQDAFAGKFVGENSKSGRAGVRTSRLSAGLERTVDVLIAAISAVVLWQGARFVLNGSLTPGGLIVFLAYLKRGFRPLQDFAKYASRISKALAAGTRVSELLDTQPAVQDEGTAIHAPQVRGEIEFDRVRFGYDSQHLVLSDLSFRIAAGEHVAIVGPSGAGKSTILALLLRLFDPEQGRILIDGQDIRSWTLRSLRDQQAIVLQDNDVFAASVGENIALAAREASLEIVRSAAEKAQADEFIRRLPQGYETILGERGATLSHGQRQRLAIARTILRSSPILLLDEPTSNLDAANRSLVATALREAAQNRTTLLVTHDLELAAKSDRILFLADNGQFEFATPSELMTRNGAYARLVRESQKRDVPIAKPHFAELPSTELPSTELPSTSRYVPL